MHQVHFDFNINYRASEFMGKGAALLAAARAKSVKREVRIEVWKRG
jgi:hypothetical protein